MLLMLVLSIMLPSRGVYADSNDRITTFIHLAAGKQTTDVDMNSLSLSERDLRFLGVYISNFFVPFGTELGDSGNSGDNDVTTMNKEDIKKALQTNINYSDSLAESLTETLLGLSRNSVKELSLCVSEKYQGDLVPLSDGNAQVPLNSYTAFSCMLGGLPEVLSWYKDEDCTNSVIEGVLDGTYKYGYFAYSTESGYVPVFDFRIDMSELTASAAAFIKCLESVEMELGYGTNFFDFTESETGAEEGNFEDILTRYTDNQILSMSTYGVKLAVDCFGNIIYMGGNHQFIAVPGCMNPYTWVSVNNKGDDIDKGGSVYNMINIPSMALYEGGVDVNANTLLKGNTSGSGLVKSGVLETKTIVNKLKPLRWKDLMAIGEKDGAYTMRLIRGNSVASFSDWKSIMFGSNTSYEKVAERAEIGFKDSYPNAYNYYYSSGGGISSSNPLLNLSNVIVYGVNLEDNAVSLENSDSKTDTNIRLFDSFVYLDNLGAFHFDNSAESTDFTTFNVSSYISDSDELKALKDSMKNWGSSASNGFTNTYKTVENGKMVIPSDSVSKEGMVGLYVTYAFSSLYDESSKESTVGKLGFRMNSDTLPSIPDEPLSLSDSVKSDMMLTSIRDWTYYLLHPTEGTEYFKVWITNKLNSFMLGWHDDMVGTNGTGSINGTTKYRGFSGYVTTPELTDIPWTNSLLNLYNNSIPFLLVVMVLIMLGSYVVGVLSFQKAVIGLVIFSIGISLPSVFINGAVGTANRFSSSLYGEKFTYWALVQHESYSTAIDKASSGDSYSNYLKTLYATNSKVTGNQGSESVMVKWQAPKKMSSLMLTEEDKGALGGLGSSLLSGLLNSTYSGESYLEDDSVYLYRSYIDIANFSRYIHRGLKESTKQPINQNITNDMMKDWSEELQTSIRDYGKLYEYDRTMGYANLNGDGSTTGNSNKIIRVRLPLSSKLVNEQLANKGSISEMSLNDYVGVNQDAFEFSIPMFNVGSSELVFKEQLKTDNFDTSKYTNEDFSALAAYGLMSENPFYYFSWYLYEAGLSEETSSRVGYRSLLLKEDNAGFFYNTVGNGEMKDFMDMRSLFTYIIPYLKECNELVYEWDDTYGIYIHGGVPVEEGHADDPDIKDNPELRQKYWHNLNVSRLYNMYSPWVDVMYDCSYAESEKIRFLGEDYVIVDPINPASYPDERPMVFSRSEMLDYGLKENNLTKVEKLIIKCQDGMQERLFKLLNYHTFNDVVLNTAAAINCAFEFNTVFSENSAIGANHNIYPQSFELNDFSYDAFLRFILSNSTGDSMIVEQGGDFYSNVVNNSSMTTIIVMLVLDILAMFVIPGFKIFFIVGIFLLSVLLIISTAFRVDQQQKFIPKFINSFIQPIVKFLLITCGMSLVVSWFMGEGNTSITGSMETSIALGDPVMAMLVMIVLNCFVVYFYFKIIRDMVKDIKREGRLVASFVSGVVGSLGGRVFRGATASGGGSGSSSSDSSSDGEGRSRMNRSSRAEVRASSHRLSDKDEKRGDDSSNDTQERSRRNVFGKRGSKRDNILFKTPIDIEDKANSGLDKINSTDNDKNSTERG